MIRVDDPNLIAQLEAPGVQTAQTESQSTGLSIDDAIKTQAADIVRRASEKIGSQNKPVNIDQVSAQQNNVASANQSLKPVTDPNLINQLESPGDSEEKSLPFFSEALARILGMPVDIISEAMKEVGVKIKKPVGGSESMIDTFSAVQGPGEVAVTMGTGAIAEPVAGVAGIVQTLNPLADEGAGAEAVEATRDLITVQPKTDAGKESLQNVIDVIEPVAEAFEAAEDFLGNKTMEATNSPALAAAAKTIPTAITEILGIAGAKGALKTKAGRDEKTIIREIKDAAPTAEQLKETSRQVYKEIDELGVTIHEIGYQSLVKKLNQLANDSGVDPDITPSSAKALKRFNDRIGDSVSLTELDTLRKVAQNAADTLNKSDKRLATLMVNAVDDFLDQAKPQIFNGTPESVAQVSKRYRVARELWGRASRSEMLTEAFEKARNQASGFENGVRVQFRSILNNPKKRRYFNDEELHAMNKVVRGGKGENFAKLIGRLGFSEGGSTNILGTSLGIGFGATTAGAPGAVIVPLIGQVSRKLAQRMTANNAKFADQVIRAGKDAKKITKAYLDNTPKELRSADELSELLMKKDVDLSTVPGESVVQEAAKIAQQKRIALASGAAAGAISPIESAAEDDQSSDSNK